MALPPPWGSPLPRDLAHLPNKSGHPSRRKRRPERVTVRWILLLVIMVLCLGSLIVVFMR